MTGRSRYRRTGLFFPLLLVAIGVLFLLTNLDLIDRDAWQQIWRFWPVLLILLGLDLLGGRRSIGTAVSSLLGILVLVGAAFALFHLFAPDTWITDVQTLSQSLSGATEADLALSCEGCSIEVRGEAREDLLIEGSVSLRWDDRLHQSVVRRGGGSVSYELESEPFLPFLLTASQSEHAWRLRLSDTVPIELSIEAGRNLTVDLRTLQITTADLATSAGDVTVTLPTSGHALLYVGGESLRVRVPAGSAVRLLGTAPDQYVLPDGYTRFDDTAQSPGYETANATAEILLRPTIRSVLVEQIGADSMTESPAN